VDVTGWEELEDFKLKASWRFKCILDLPWKPTLAAAGVRQHSRAAAPCPLDNCAR
jgi:hypothetical protein